MLVDNQQIANGLNTPVEGRKHKIATAISNTAMTQNNVLKDMKKIGSIVLKTFASPVALTTFAIESRDRRIPLEI